MNRVNETKYFFLYHLVVLHNNCENRGSLLHENWKISRVPRISELLESPKTENVLCGSILVFLLLSYLTGDHGHRKILRITLVTIEEEEEGIYQIPIILP